MDIPRYLFYSVIGPHGGETVEQILSRKEKEIKDTGYSLWAAKINKESIRRVWGLSKDDTVYVYCHCNLKAKDPAAQSATATHMIGPNGKELIADGITATFKKTYNEQKPYQAYVVRRYHTLPETLKFDFEHYESFTRKGEVSFGERFRLKQFQNTFGQYNEDISCHEEKDIHVIMELQYPFVVSIF